MEETIHWQVERHLWACHFGSSEVKLARVEPAYNQCMQVTLAPVLAVPETVSLLFIVVYGL